MCQRAMTLLDVKGRQAGHQEWPPQQNLGGHHLLGPKAPVAGCGGGTAASSASCCRCYCSTFRPFITDSFATFKIPFDVLIVETRALQGRASPSLE